MSGKPSSTPNEQTTFTEPTYEWQEYVEYLEVYHEGGYHPVHLHDEYSNGRYRIIHKLGFGSYSTVWLARDQHVGRYVALKIIIAEASKTSSESQILRCLSKFKSNHALDRYVSPMLDNFSIDGPNGRHLCIVSPPARCNIADSKEASLNHMFPLDVSRAMAAQAVMGLHGLHSSGVVHGDLHPRNILFTLPDIDSLTIEELYQRFGEPQKNVIERVDGAPLGPEVPAYSVWPAQLVIASDEITHAQIMISDFGEAWLSDGEPPQDLQTPVMYAPPETTFAKDSFGKPVDIWTLGCTVFEILGRRMLFEGIMADKNDIIADMVSALGMPPQKWWGSWPARGEFFHEDGSWRKDLTRCDAFSRPLSLRLQERVERSEDSGFSEDEVLSLEAMLRAMLAYEPSKRATASQVMESDWMKRRGIPALKKEELEWSNTI